MHAIVRLNLGLVLVAGLAAPAAAHIQLQYPGQRTSKQKDGPCGAPAADPLFDRGDTVTRLAPGSTITVAWDETVEHAGHFRISFDADGQDFQRPVTGNEDFAETLVDDIADRVVSGAGDDGYTADITLPDIECDRCTLQVIQVMKVSPPFAEGDLYYQCADLVLGDFPAADAGPDDPGAEPAGGGCAVTAGGVWSGDLALASLLVVLLLRRRRRR